MVTKFQICYSLFLQGHHLFHATNQSSFQAQKNANPQDPRTRLLDKREEIWCEREGGIALSASNGVSGPRRYEAFGDKLSF
jgi:hypothetical protein